MHARLALPAWIPKAIAAVAFVVAALPGAHAQTFEQGLGDPRIISPAGLGPSYSGLLGAGIGLVSKKPRFGLQAGEFVIQPHFFLESEYRTNFFRVDARNGEAEGAFSLHARPGVALFNPEFDTVAFSLGLDVDAFIPIGNDNAAKQTNAGGKAQMSVAFFPKKAFTLTLFDTFDRTLWMRPQIGSNANRNHNVAGIDLGFHPGGRALDFTLGYAYDLVRYDEIAKINTDNHNIRLLGSWRFYPMTYAFLESMVTIAGYTEDPSAAEAKATGNFVPGTPVKVYLGLSGYITERLAVLARAGYGNSLLDSGENFNSFIGQLQVSWRFGPKSILHVGVARDFEMAPLGGFSQYFRAYTQFSQRIGELVDLNIDFAYDLRSYGLWQPAQTSGTVTIVSDPNRAEHWIRAGALVDFDISRIFGATLGYRYDRVLTDFQIQSSGIVNFVGYEDHRLFATLNLRY